eukprot:s2040_g13.t1
MLRAALLDLDATTHAAHAKVPCGVMGGLRLLAVSLILSFRAVVHTDVRTHQAYVGAPRLADWKDLATALAGCEPVTLLPTQVRNSVRAWGRGEGVPCYQLLLWSESWLERPEL